MTPKGRLRRSARRATESHRSTEIGALELKERQARSGIVIGL